MRQEKKTAFEDCQSKLAVIKDKYALSNNDLSTLIDVKESAIEDALNGNASVQTKKKLIAWLGIPTKIEYYPNGKRLAILMPDKDFHTWIFAPISYSRTSETWKRATR